MKNPASASRSGTLSWRCGNGWKVTPADMTFNVEGGREIKQIFTVVASSGASLVPPPALTVNWYWSDVWAYPMTTTGSIQFAPQLIINKAAVKSTLTGKLDEWKDATSFTLDDRYFINPAVPGRKLLWGGPNDLSGQFFLKWDEAAFYVAVMVRDEEHIQNARKVMAWSQDCVMLAFSMKENDFPNGRQEFVFAAYPDADEIITTIGAVKNVGSDIRFASSLNHLNGTCLYEMAIPWARVKPFIPETDKSFRFTLCIGDADSKPGKGFNYLAWTPGINYSKSPAEFATIVLGKPK
jgi:hypothetical protein